MRASMEVTSGLVAQSTSIVTSMVPKPIAMSRVRRSSVLSSPERTAAAVKASATTSSSQRVMVAADGDEACAYSGWIEQVSLVSSTHVVVLARRSQPTSHPHERHALFSLPRYVRPSPLLTHGPKKLSELSPRSPGALWAWPSSSDDEPEGKNSRRASQHSRNATQTDQINPLFEPSDPLLIGTSGVGYALDDARAIGSRPQPRVPGRSLASEYRSARRSVRPATQLTPIRSSPG